MNLSSVVSKDYSKKTEIYLSNFSLGEGGRLLLQEDSYYLRFS